MQRGKLETLASKRRWGRPTRVTNIRLAVSVGVTEVSYGSPCIAIVASWSSTDAPLRRGIDRLNGELLTALLYMRLSFREPLEVRTRWNGYLLVAGRTTFHQPGLSEVDVKHFPALAFDANSG